MTTATLPQPQHMEALALANEVRFAQTDLFRSIRSLPSNDSHERAAAVLREPCEVARGALLGRILQSVKRFGPRRIDGMLLDVGMPRGRLIRRVGELTERERVVLAEWLEGTAQRGRALAERRAGK